MRWSLSLGKIFGIRLKIHWTFWLLIAWVIIAEVMRGSSTMSVVLTTVYVFSIFGCVVLHEFGHALTARQYGVPTRKITLLPIGGIASLQRIPEKPKQELLVAVAGPLVNVVIAAIIYPFLGPLESYIPQAAQGEAQAQAQALTITPENFWFFLFSINVLLVLFNLIPAFPMDGGRMLRSLLAMNMNRMKATSIASSIGQFVAVIFFFAGLFLNPFLLLIGVFVFFGAKGENMMVQQYEVLKNHKVEEAMLEDIPTFDSSTELKDAADHLLSSTDDTFLVTDNGDVQGWVTRDEIIKGLKEHGPDSKVTGIIKKDFDTLKPKDKLSRVMEMMQSKKQNVFPIMENGKLKGVLNSGSLQNFIAVQSALEH